jgi:hypothetical protein
VVNFGLEAVEGGTQRGIAWWAGRYDLGEFWA